MNKKIFKGMSLAAISAVIATTMSTPVFAAVDAIIVKDNKTGNLTEYSLKEIKKSQIEKMMGGEGKLYKSYLNKLNDGKVYSYHDDEINDYVDAAKANKAYRDGLVSGNHIKIDDYTKTASAEAIIVPEGTMVKETIGENGEIVENPIEKPVEKTEIKEVSAINGTVTVTFNKELKEVPAEIKVFKDGEALEVKAEDMKLVEGKLVIIVPVIEATEEEQSVVYGVQLGENEIKNAEAVKVDAKDLTAPTVKVGTVENYQTLKVEFSEKVVGTPEVKVNGQDAKAILAEDGLSLTIKNEAGYAAGTYNVTINGLTDEGKNEMAKDTVVSIVKEVSIAAKAEIVTEKLQAEKTEVTGTIVTLTAVDQYGQGISLNGAVVKAYYGTMPIAEEIVAEGKVTIKSSALVKDREIKLEVYANDKDSKAIKVGEKILTVVEEKLKAASIDSITRTATEDIKAGDTINLTAKVLDQFGNVMEKLKTGDLRWTTSDLNVVKFANKTTSFDDGVQGALTMDLVAVANGTATITAFLPDGSASKTFEISVVDGEVAKIDATGVNPSINNKEALEKANVTVNEVDKDGALVAGTLQFLNKTSNGKNIPVKTDSVNFEVVAEKGFKSEDVNIEKVSDENNNLIGLKITSNRTELTTAEKGGDYSTGVNYTIKVKSNVKDVAETSFTFNSKIDNAVATIDDITFDKNEVTAGGNVKKALVFKNQYGEVINVKAEEVHVKSSNQGDLPEGAILLKNDEKGEFVSGAQGVDVVTGIEIKPIEEAKGRYSLLITTGVASKNVEVNVAEKSQLKEIKLGNSSVEVIANDKLDAEKPSDDDDIVVVGKKAYKLIPVSFKDQYGNEINVKGSNDRIKLQNDKKENINNVEMKKFADLKTEATEAQDVKYIGVAATDKVNGNVYVNYVNDNKVLASSQLTVNVNDERKINSITVDNSDALVAVNGKRTIKISTKDQYGRFFELSNANEIKVEPSKKGILSIEAVKEVKDKQNIIGYEFEITGEVKDKVTLDISNGDKKATVNVTVDSVGKLVDSVKLETKEEQKSLYYSARKVKDVDEDVELKTTAYDKDGSEISVDKSTLHYEVESVKGTKIKEEKEVEAGKEDINVDNGVVNVDNSFKGEVTFKVTTDNNKESNLLTLKFDSEEPVATSNLTVKNAKEIDADKDETNGIQIVFAEDRNKDEEVTDADMQETLTLVALDQYGNEVEEVNAKITTDDPTIIKVNKNDKVNKIEAIGSGKANVFVKFNGETINIKVEVSGEVAKLLDEKNNKAQALKVAKIEFTEKVAEYDKYEETDYTEASWKEFKNKVAEQTKVVEGASDVANVKIAQQAVEEAAKSLVTNLEAAKTALNGAIQAAEGGYVKVSVDGSDIATAEKWTTEADKTALENEVEAAKSVVENKDATTKDVEDATAKLKLAVKTYTDAQQDGTKAE